MESACQCWNRQVPFGPPCTGKADDPLCKAIVAWQQSRSVYGSPLDGHISKFAGDSFHYSGAKDMQLYLLAAINAFINDGLGDRWPRIDLIQGCPLELKTSINGYFDWNS
jgi:hypothetical protein